MKVLLVLMMLSWRIFFFFSNTADVCFGKTKRIIPRNSSVFRLRRVPCDVLERTLLSSSLRNIRLVGGDRVYGFLVLRFFLGCALLIPLQFFSMFFLFVVVGERFYERLISILNPGACLGR
jgi:hypothetical protein